MAKIDVMPHRSIISGYKGLLDFYVHRGQPCARSWPRKPQLPRSEAVMETAEFFGELAQEFSDTPPNIRSRAADLALGTAWTWRDLRYRATYGHLLT